jgi:hypothetical protein
MSASPRSEQKQQWMAPLVGLVLLGLTVSVSGCGLLGSGDDGDDQKYPEPPGRPGTAMVEGRPPAGCA